MYNRRELLKTTAAAASVLAVGSVSRPLAAAATPYLNVIYTKDQPGAWAGKAGSHAPEVTVNGSSVTLVTKHPMSEQHFIVRHTLVLEDGTPVGAKTFTPLDVPESRYQLPAGYKGKCSATSFCNQHDFWLTEVQI